MAHNQSQHMYNYLYVSSVSICSTSGGEYGSHSLCLRTTVLTRLVSPKSQSLIREKSLRNTSILSSLMSRCTSSRLCMWCTAAASCLATLFAWSSPSPVSVTFDVRSPENHVTATKTYSRIKCECHFLALCNDNHFVSNYIAYLE